MAATGPQEGRADTLPRCFAGASVEPTGPGPIRQNEMLLRAVSLWWRIDRHFGRGSLKSAPAETRGNEPRTLWSAEVVERASAPQAVHICGGHRAAGGHDLDRHVGRRPRCA